jgi:hypothetical protein
VQFGIVGHPVLSWVTSNQMECAQKTTCHSVRHSRRQAGSPTLWSPLGIGRLTIPARRRTLIGYTSLAPRCSSHNDTSISRLRQKTCRALTCIKPESEKFSHKKVGHPSPKNRAMDPGKKHGPYGKTLKEE